MSAGKRVAKTRKKKISGGAIAGIIVAVVVVAACAGIGVAGAKAANSDVIYPKVSANGIDVGGMSLVKATETLDASGAITGQDDSVKLSFPNGSILEVSRSDAGIAVTPEDVARMAYDYGRSGNFVTNSLSYIKCALTGAALSTDDIMRSLDEENLRAIVSEKAVELNTAAAESAYRISGDNLIITKGAAGYTVSEDDIYNAVVNAFTQEQFELQEFSGGESGESTIDLDAVYDAVFTEPVSAVYDTETKSVTESVTGVSFDKAAAQKLFNSAGLGSDIAVPLIYTEPEMTTEQLTSMLFRDVLASKDTSMATSSSNRINNITIAANAINGTILNPGDEFSYNGTVGQRTAAKGYKPAGAYVGGETVQEIGGGI
ncbi:MAG: VanW family protein, partial [Oscillospiraceae bacterium]|nr:VanW family protein [Oscillospiraceae bacterium]